MQNPLNSKVAPKRESIKLPHNPANVARGNTHSCFKPTTLVEHVAVNKPKRTNVKPITLPANAAASSPVLVTPPFVPFLTGYILKKKKPNIRYGCPRNKTENKRGRKLPNNSKIKLKVFVGTWQFIMQAAHD